MSRFDDLKKSFVDQAPAPHNETVDYARFSSFFVPIAFGISLLLPYIIIFIFADYLEEVMIWFATKVPIFDRRIYFLRSIDDFSDAAYAATLNSGIIILIGVFTANFFGYRKSVVLPKKLRRAGPLTVVSMLFMTMTIFLLGWASFIDAPVALSGSQLGMSRVLLWPFFPALGAAVFFLSSILAFSISVGVVKLTLKLGENNG